MTEIYFSLTATVLRFRIRIKLPETETNIILVFTDTLHQKVKESHKHNCMNRYLLILFKFLLMIVCLEYDFKCFRRVKLGIGSGLEKAWSQRVNKNKFTSQQAERSYKPFVTRPTRCHLQHIGTRNSKLD